MKLSQYFTSHSKINAKWITGLNVNPKAIKLTEQRRKSMKILEHRDF